MVVIGLLAGMFSSQYDVAKIMEEYIPDLNVVDLDDKENFTTTLDLDRLVLSKWRENTLFVNLPPDRSNFKRLLTRPFFILVHLSTPISIQWDEYQKSVKEPQFKDFISKVDNFNRINKMHELEKLCQFSFEFEGSKTNLKTLQSFCEDLTNPESLRPGWDSYFMSLCFLTASRSNCMKQRVGAIVVKEKRVLSAGYNGTPHSMAQLL
eukprot:GHVP01031135.1.p1 GENE.GHVP01031135.1~~GHVP01031135.1.p1  ORF type:complete len:208 (+),score=28.16 GHVP01031135.1:34-657(+)